MQEVFEKIIEKLEACKDIMLSPKVSDCFGEQCKHQDCTVCAFSKAIEIVQQAVAEYNNGWIPCEEELPPQPEENTVFDNKHLELYLVSIRGEKYPFRAFWNGKFFTDGWSKVYADAWQPLPPKYQAKGE